MHLLNQNYVDWSIDEFRNEEVSNRNHVVECKCFENIWLVDGDDEKDVRGLSIFMASYCFH